MTVLNKKKEYHFVGIGGIGMSGLASILIEKGEVVSGSDRSCNAIIVKLQRRGVRVFQGHDANNISPQKVVIYSSAISDDNPEYLAAKRLGCRMMHRSELLKDIMEDYQVLAVAGTHGKTTTSSLLAAMLVQAGYDPAYAVGGVILQFDTNAKHGKGDVFVVEADESDGTFLKYRPFGSIVTNIDTDHMDHYGTEEALIAAYQAFIDQVTSKEHLLWCGDDHRLRALRLPGWSFGYDESCDVRVSHCFQKGWNVVFDINMMGKLYTNIEVALLGRHNASNAAAVFALAMMIGAPEERVREGLKAFKGIKRRCEKKGEIGDILIVDDYAHHPTEISATLGALRGAFPDRKLVVLFQPHRYSRLQYCLGSFCHVFDAVDQIVITDLYAAGEAPIAGISHEVLVEEVSEASKVPCQYVPRSDLVSYGVDCLRPGDVMVTLGAGDITKVSDEVAAKLRCYSKE